jgi:electron transport complex protein RnfB
VHALRLPRLPRYAQAIATGEAAINRCPPGGAEGIVRLAASRPARHCRWTRARGREGPRALAVIDEAWCIGCTLCIKACPVDCIVGASKLMHTVVEPLCTGCELCVPVCPVDCIEMRPRPPRTPAGQAWSPAQAEEARATLRLPPLSPAARTARERRALAEKAQAKLADLAQHSQHTDPAVLDAKRAVIEAALQRARAKRQTEPDRDA